MHKHSVNARIPSAVIIHKNRLKDVVVMVNVVGDRDFQGRDAAADIPLDRICGRVKA